MNALKLSALLVAAIGLCGCNAVVRGTRLSNVPIDSTQMFLSTGGSPAKYRTLGFVQIRGYGIEVAGMADVGDAQLDGTIKGSLATQAAKMGGSGVINIEFYDENPSTDIERANAAYSSMGNMLQGKAPESKERWVTVTGEVIQFVQ